MKRRNFIQTSSLMTLPVLLNGMDVTAIAQSRLSSLLSPGDDRVLVLVQLNGGNDGLNTLIPLDQYTNLTKVRKSILIPESQVLKLNEKTGLNPSMGGFERLAKEGMLAAVQGVGYPNQNRSHFRSTDIWTTASDSEQYITTGWLGRYFDLNHSSFPENYPSTDFPDPFAITLGNVVSETCQGNASNFSFAITSENDLKTLSETNGVAGDESCHSSEVAFVRDIIRQTNAYSSQVKAAFDKGNNLVTYPTENTLANQLKIVANLISGGLRTKIYVVNLGGFDTHANQIVAEDPINGTHAELLRDLSDAIEMFQRDLIALGVDHKVLGMTFSEFGRRIKANDSFGSDHGSAAPLFVFGSCVDANLFGTNPQISDNVGNDEGVAMQYDFRSIYATILMDWFKVSKEEIKRVLFKDFLHLPFIKGCETITGVDAQSDPILDLYPNPASDIIHIKFENNTDLSRVQIFDLQGFMLYDTQVNLGGQALPISIEHLPPGAYVVRVETNKEAVTKRFVKVR